MGELNNKMTVNRLLLLLMFVFCFVGARSQALTEGKADTLSYRYYFENKYDSLVMLSKQAKKADVSTYYLHIRTAIAHYNHKNCKAAIPEFWDALKFNSYDTVALEYLYNCYLIEGFNSEAHHIAARFPDNLRKRYKVKRFVLADMMYLGGGVFKNNNSIPTTTVHAKDVIYGDVDNSGSTSYTQFDMVSFLGHRIRLHSSVSYMNIDKEHQLSYKLTDYITNPFVPTVKQYDSVQNNKMTQLDYYFNASCFLSSTISVSLAYHGIQNKFDKFGATYDSLKFKYNFSKTPQVLNNQLLSVGVKKEWGYNYVKLNVAFMDLYGGKQIQTSLSALYYPFNQTKVYGNTSLAVKSGDKKIKPLISQKIGARFGKRLLVEGFVIGSNIKGFSDDEGSVVYNMVESPKFKTGTSVSLKLMSHLWFNVHYSYLSLSNSYMTMPNAKTVNYQTNKYTQHNIIGGIIWQH